MDNYYDSITKEGSDSMVKVYFVRHAQPDHSWKDDRTRPLTDQALIDRKQVAAFFQDKEIHHFYCSPYKRSYQTIETTAKAHGMEIATDERLRERVVGITTNDREAIARRWDDFDYHEEGGESMGSLQKRNVEAFHEILHHCSKEAENGKEISIVIGTHGSALSSILHYYDNSFSGDDFFRIMHWMPYIIELDFEDNTLVNRIEHLHIERD